MGERTLTRRVLKMHMAPRKYRIPDSTGLWKLQGICVFLFCCATLCRARYPAEGTPAELRHVVIGRCEDYKKGYINSEVNHEVLKEKNCTELWELIYNTFAYREPCDVTIEDYDKFMSAAAHDYPTDSTLFWSGWDIFDAVREFSFRGNRKTTLDRTLAAYMMFPLYFCGSTTDPSGVNTTMCPGFTECGFGVGSRDAFWASASIYFAERSKGYVRIFLNSNRPGGAYHLSNESYFAAYELPVLTKERVSFFEINLVTALGEKPGDSCSSGSIIELKRVLEEKEIPHSCIENPSDVLHMLCIDDADHEDCMRLRTSIGQQVLLSALSPIGLFLTIILSVAVLKQRKLPVS